MSSGPTVVVVCFRARIKGTLGTTAKEQGLPRQLQSQNNVTMILYGTLRMESDSTASNT